MNYKYQLQKEEMEQALDNFLEAWENLSNRWEKFNPQTKHDSYPFEKPFDAYDIKSWVDEFSNSLDVEEEKTIPLTYGLLNRKIDWEDLHTLIGVGYYSIREGYEIKDTEVFNIKVSDAERYGLI